MIPVSMLLRLYPPHQFPSSQTISENVSKTESKGNPSRSAKPVSDDANKVAYLTFDDGPTEMTPKIIETLKQYQAKATFFVVYKSSEKLANYMKFSFRRRK